MTAPADQVLVMPGLPALMAQALAASGLSTQPLLADKPVAEPGRIFAIAAHGGSSVPTALVESLPSLRMIAVHGVGYDGVDVAHAQARGVVVTNTPDVLTDDVADLALMLVLATLRRAGQAERMIRDGRWAAGDKPPLTRRATGLRYGVLGLGRIGQAIARRLEPIAGSIAYHARRPVEGVAYERHADATSLAGAVDVLIVATPGGPATRRLVDARVLDALGPHGVLINIARGEVVDQAALIDALAADRLGGAGLDVFEDEPRVPQALIDDPRCVLTPHIGSSTVETRRAMADLVIANLRAGLGGRPPVTPVHG